MQKMHLKAFLSSNNGVPSQKGIQSPGRVTSLLRAADYNIYEQANGNAEVRSEQSKVLSSACSMTSDIVFFYLQSLSAISFHIH